MKKEDFILKTWPFLTITFVYLLTGLTLHKFYGQDGLHVMLNQCHSSFADFFFAYFTKTGEFLFGLLVLMWIVYKNNWRWVVMFLFSALLQGVWVQIMKKSMFIDHLRPAFYFQEKGVDLHLVDGVRQGITFTFPSGHTATAFFVFLFLAMLSRHRWTQFLMGICAVFAAYSRVYLSQHFVLDTVAGALIGTFSVVLSYYLFQQWNLPLLNKKVIKR